MQDRATFNRNIPNLPYNETTSPLRQSNNGAPVQSPRSTRVRFSVPTIDRHDEGARDLSFISETNSPTKILYPESNHDNYHHNNYQYDDRTGMASYKNNDNNNTNTTTPNRANSTALNNIHDECESINGHLIDLQNKVLIDVPKDIYNFHNEKNSNRHFNNNINKNVYAHNRSKSLQSIISYTVKHNRSNSLNSLKNHDASSLSNISNVSPLNIPSLNPLQSNLYLTSDSPINKQNVPIPLEISLPPFLSPINKNKKRNSLIYDGNSYSVYDSNEESSSVINDNDNTADISNSFVEDSMIANDSIPSADYNISFDVNSQDTDKLLGIDTEANVNLKLQIKNLKKQKQRNKNVLSEEQDITTEVPPTRVKTPNQKNSSTFQNDINTSNHKSSKPLENNMNTPNEKSANCSNNNNRNNAPKHNINTPKNTFLSPKATNESLKILSSPSKSIVIPDLDNILLRTPVCTPNGSLKIFDHFNDVFNSSSNENSKDINILMSPSSVKNNRSLGTLDTQFKFPNNLEHNTLDNKKNTFFTPTTSTSDDFQKTPQTNPEFEKRRQKLVEANLSPTNHTTPRRHAHRRSRSIISMNDIISPHKSPINTSDLPPLPAFDATSTPPHIAKPSPLRNNKLQDNSINDSVIINSLGEKTEESLQILQINHLTNLNEEKANIKPLSSFQSFSTPIQTNNSNGIIPEIKINEFKNKHKKASTNLLSPRRQLSNAGSNTDSQQSSSVNSQFSNATKGTQASSAVASSSPIFNDPQRNNQSNLLKLKSQANANTQPSKSKNANFKIIKEKQQNGNLVDVIILDDAEDEESEKIHVINNNRYDAKSTIETTHTSHKNYLSSNTTKTELMGNYEDILSMCEQTATIAKETIYELSGATTENQETVHINANARGSSPMKINQQNRYLQNLNRSLKNHSRSKSIQQ